MGHGIAHAALMGGYDTVMYDVAPAAVEKGRRAIGGILEKGVELGKVTSADAAAATARLTTTTSLAEALRGSSFIIEAAPEQIALKLALLAEIEQLAPADAVIASNTSSLSVTEMAAALSNPRRLAGMHFFNPVHKMKLVEIVRALESSDETLQAIEGRRAPDGQGDGRRPRLGRVRHEPRERDDRQRGVLHAAGRRRARRATSTRR